MEFIGTFAVGRSKNLNTMYIYQSVRKPGFVWSLVKGKKFQCCGCRRLRKMRCISIENGTLISSGKHPEDEHHDQCQPLPEGGCYTHFVIGTYGLQCLSVNVCITILVGNETS